MRTLSQKRTSGRTSEDRFLGREVTRKWRFREVCNLKRLRLHDGSPLFSDNTWGALPVSKQKSYDIWVNLFDPSVERFRDSGSATVLDEEDVRAYAPIIQTVQADIEPSNSDDTSIYESFSGSDIDSNQEVFVGLEVFPSPPAPLFLRESIAALTQAVFLVLGTCIVLVAAVIAVALTLLRLVVGLTASFKAKYMPYLQSAFKTRTFVTHHIMPNCLDEGSANTDHHSALGSLEVEITTNVQDSAPSNWNMHIEKNGASTAVQLDVRVEPGRPFHATFRILTPRLLQNLGYEMRTFSSS
ncbi:hypothetical protein OF83DRAFT_1086491 [Amylostereum chailletii]|nr:hypothetical protein OF83DRAFT_1086491 [Amylostereum chailletii]